MKTDNIFIAELAYSTKIEQNGGLYDYYLGESITNRVYFHPIKYVIVKKNKYSYKTATDLETNKKYLYKLPTRVGSLYLPPSRMLAFDAIYPNEKRNLSKRKILSLGKKAIKEFERVKNEQK